MSEELRPFELLYHSAMPNWCKISGLTIKAIPEWEGGGFMVQREQAERIVADATERARLEAENEILRGERDGFKALAEVRADREWLKRDNERLRKALEEIIVSTPTDYARADDTTNYAHDIAREALRHD